MLAKANNQSINLDFMVMDIMTAELEIALAEAVTLVGAQATTIELDEAVDTLLAP